MPVKRLQTYRFDLDREAFKRPSPFVMEGLLDMLRYDQATVANNSTPGFITFETPLAPTVDRWKSFGFYPKNVRKEIRY